MAQEILKSPEKRINDKYEEKKKNESASSPRKQDRGPHSGYRIEKIQNLQKQGDTFTSRIEKERQLYEETSRRVIVSVAFGFYEFQSRTPRNMLLNMNRK